MTAAGVSRSGSPTLSTMTSSPAARALRACQCSSQGSMPSGAMRSTRPENFIRRSPRSFERATIDFENDDLSPRGELAARFLERRQAADAAVSIPVGLRQQTEIRRRDLDAGRFELGIQ